ncbi:hypothetical protein [Halovenus salina]|uniref:Uncharacterized protein n=1 Tax=Halovenus salina TaxID=1510225 RepID=A0ABD5W428_9EURY
MSTETATARERAREPTHVDKTPTPDAGKTTFQIPVSADDPALRVIFGRYTIDLLPDLRDGKIVAMVGTGDVGQPPQLVQLPLELVPLLGVAGSVRARSVLETAGWVIAR